MRRSLTDSSSPETKICSQCHQEKLLTDFAWRNHRKGTRQSKCRLCRAAWNYANRERLSLIQKEYYEKNKEKILAQQSIYHENNKESQQNYQAEYYKSNAEKLCREAKIWHSNNPDKVREHRQRRKTLERNLPCDFTTTQRQFMLKYWNHACAYCGNQEGLLWRLADDHFIPLVSSDCPGTIATNMLPACHSATRGGGGCNSRKRSADPHVWLRRQFGDKQAAKIEKAITAYFVLVTHRSN